MSIGPLEWPITSIDWRIIPAYALGAVILYFTVRLVAIPLKQTVRLAANAAVGLVILLLFNYVGGNFGFHVPLNPVTALVAGMLGIPGVGLMVALQHVVL